MHIASHHNLSLQLIHKFFILLPVKSFKHILQNTDAVTEVQVCLTSMLNFSLHNDITTAGIFEEHVWRPTVSQM